MKQSPIARREPNIHQPDLFELTKPMSVTVEQDEDGMYLASDSITTVYGYGEDGAEALEDYIVSLIEYYELLEGSDSLTAVSAFDSLRGYLYKI